MNKLYVTLPLLGLLIFGGIYWNHAIADDARLAAQKRRDELARQESIQKETAARTLAQQMALAAQARRNEERAAREQLEAMRKQAILEAEHRRNLAIEQEKKSRARLARLHAELDFAQAALGRLEERQGELRREQVFLADCVRQAEDNRAAFYELLEKIEARENSPPPPARSRNLSPQRNG